MKKITLFILTIFTVATLFAAARPSLDGRAVVADSGTMPKGLFARTVGYLPGDSVTVTNPATGSTIDVLILGAIDPSEGVAILLSPEAADGLRIKPNSDVQVKLTKRSGSLDENANGSAVLSEGDDADSVAEESAPAENKADYAEYPAVAQPEESESIVESPAASEESPYVAEKSPVYEEIPAEAEEEEEPVEEIPVIAEKTPAYEKVEENPAAAKKPVEEVPVEETPVSLVAENEVEEEVVPETVYEELPPLPADKKLQKVVVIELEGEKEAEDGEESLVAAEEVPVSEEKVVAEEKIATEEKIAAEEIPVTEEADQVVELDSLPAVEEEPVVVMNESPVEEESADEYQPIVLVPSEPNPPLAAAELVAESEPVSEPEKDIIPVKEEVSAPKIVVSNSWTNYIVPSVKNLRSGSYYVQVASLGNTENIKNFVDKYSSKYPVVLVQNSSKSAYQVMVGPLNIDEYGAVGEKFRDYGFKDSFVRKIK